MIHLQGKSRIIAFSVIGTLIIALGIYGVIRFQALQAEVQKMKSSPQAAQLAAKEDAKRLVEQISKLISVPQDETPTVATVQDAEKLKTSPFFANAKTGDRVLIYTTAKKAIIYRPTENKIIEVGPISIGTPSAQPVTTESINVVLYNGTSVTGLTKKYETALKSKVSTAAVVDRDNATKSDYDKTIVVDIKKDKATQVKALADTLGITVSELPAGEIAPKIGDFLIIVGTDKK